MNWKKGGRMSNEQTLEERRKHVLETYPDIAELIRLARQYFGDSTEIVVSLDEPKK